jgi:hypothetical protein
MFLDQSFVQVVYEETVHSQVVRPWTDYFILFEHQFVSQHSTERFKIDGT